MAVMSNTDIVEYAIALVENGLIMRGNNRVYYTCHALIQAQGLDWERDYYKKSILELYYPYSGKRFNVSYSKYSINVLDLDVPSWWDDGLNPHIKERAEHLKGFHQWLST